MLEVIWSACQLRGINGGEPHANGMAQRGRVLQRTVGYVLADDKAGVTLTGSLSQMGNVYGTVNIPAGQIVKRKRLR